MDLIHVLLRRAAAVSVASLFLALFFMAAQTQSDVASEADGAMQLAELSRLLAALGSSASDQLEGHIEGLNAIAQRGGLRHLTFRVDDAVNGVTLAESPRDTPAPIGMRSLTSLMEVFSTPQLPQETNWEIKRHDGQRFKINLSSNLFSEQREAYDEVVGIGAVLLVYALCLLMALRWAVRKAFTPLRHVLDTISGFEQGNFDQRLPEFAVRELDVIGRALNHFGAAMRELQEERRLLSLKLMSSQEAERAHIARELHDELGQSLTAMRADLSYLARRVDSNSDLQEVLSGVSRECASVHQHLRGLLGRLGNAPIDAQNAQASLDEMLETLVESWRQRPGQTTVFELRVDLVGHEIPSALALNLYRMTQEALTNVSRHAHAGAVLVSLSCHPEDHELLWLVCDDGVGIQSFDESAKQGNGLAAIRERVWAHGGRLEVSEHGPGLTISARFPLCPTTAAVPNEWRASR